MGEYKDMKNLRYAVLFLAFAGLLDSLFLANMHYSNIIVPCGTSLFDDCGAVLSSPYAYMFGVPLALIGVVHYLLLFAAAFVFIYKKNASSIVYVLSSIGAAASVYFVFLQLVVIGAICTYCMLSAIVSFTIFAILFFAMPRSRKDFTRKTTQILYKGVIKNILFRFDAEAVHTNMVVFGETLSRSRLAKRKLDFLYKFEDTSLEQKFAGIVFKNPIGLAAGFDYEARLTGIMPSIGCGFITVGTITNEAYEGNERPILGRLPKSKSLMVNKGFKNLGAVKTAEKLKDMKFDIPVGVSIGRTNTDKHSSFREAVGDIVKAFEVFEKSSVKHSYYEINISCPNLMGNISFYPPVNLKKLLDKIDNLNLSRPYFIKMPIEKSDKDVLEMLKVAAKSKTIGVIFGNLQKDRKHPDLVREEVKKFTKGNFSGKPTFNRSNELIRLCYKNYPKRFLIIGCGGVFSGADAYEKIKRGASLVQMITGMVYEGPQIMSQINADLADMLAVDGFDHISEAVGAEVE
jgi:dihydroorotate dehydrogenase